MICISIRGPSYEEAVQQIKQAIAQADLIELRLDLFTNLDDVKQLRALFSIPMLFTLRSALQGGACQLSEEQRLEAIRKIARLQPEYLDLENHVSPDFIHEIHISHPEIKLVISYHNFDSTPTNDELDSVYQNMLQMPTHFYKVAVTPHNSIDTLRFLQWAQRSSDGRLISISMGSHGQISRILAKLVKSPLTYAALDDNQQTAPGQLSAKTLVECYHYRSLNSKTTIYGLIGNPVDRSLSHQTHNALIQTAHLNAVYVKMQVQESELTDFLDIAKQLPFGGLSVTMPLKEHILQHIDRIHPTAQKIGAVNTILFEKGKIIGFNTDGVGALNALESEGSMQGKRMVIVGAGGAAKAITYEALQRGITVTVLNRNVEKARQIAELFHCESGGLEIMSECARSGYDILVNCTPVSIPINLDDILPHTIFMDIVTHPKDNNFEEHAKQKGCRVVHGYKMFVEQAVEQFNIWFGDVDQADQRRKTLYATISKWLFPRQRRGTLPIHH